MFHFCNYYVTFHFLEIWYIFHGNTFISIYDQIEARKEKMIIDLIEFKNLKWYNFEFKNQFNKELKMKWSRKLF